MENTPLNPKLPKVEAVCEWLTERIANQIYPVGARVPSVRQLAKQLGVSAFTVTQAYEKLVIAGRIQARRGAGYFVLASRVPAVSDTDVSDDKTIDSAWLMQHLFSQDPYRGQSGKGTLPNDWLNYARMPTVVRQVASTINQFAYQQASTQGYAALREQYALRLQQFGIHSSGSELMTTDGVSSSMSLVTRYLLKAGDAVIVDNPCWFWLLANLQAQGVRVFGVNRDAQGPDISQMKQLLENENVKLYVTNSVFHNPTGYTVNPSRTYQVVNLLHEYRTYLLEDDIYGWFDADAPALRYAALDSARVFYTTSVSKMLGMDFRQGVLCPPSEHLEGLLQYKMLTQMNNSVYMERSVLALLTDVAFRKHLQGVRQKLWQAHDTLREWLPRYGFAYPDGVQGGFFLWLDTHCDSAELALSAKKAGYLIAPGQLFSPRQTPSSRIRLNVSRTDEAFLQWLSEQREG